MKTFSRFSILLFLIMAMLVACEKEDILDSDGSGGSDDKDNNERCCDNIAEFSFFNKDGSPAKEVKVQLEGENGTSIGMGTTNGSVRFGELCEGTYQLTAYSPDGEAYKETIEVDCGETIQRRINLGEGKGTGPDRECCDNTASFSFYHKDGSLPDEVKVELTGENGTVMGKGSSSGFVRFGDLCEGTYLLKAYTAYGEVIEHKIEIKCGEMAEYRYPVGKGKGTDPNCCPGKLMFRVMDENGAARGDVMVTLKSEARSYTMKLNSANTDAFEVCAGKYKGYVRSANAGMAHEQEFEVEVLCDQMNYKEITLNSKGDTNHDDCCEGVMNVKVSTGSNTNTQMTALLLDRGQVVQKAEVVNHGVVFKGLCTSDHYSVQIISGNQVLAQTKKDLKLTGCKDILSIAL